MCSPRRLTRLSVPLVLAFVSPVLTSPAAAGDFPLEDDAILRVWAEIEMSVLKTRSLVEWGVTEQQNRLHQRIGETRMKMLWYRAEGTSFARLSSDILDDTETFRERQEKLREASETAARYVQAGLALPAYRAKFADLVMMTAFRDEVRERMNREIGPVEAQDFAGHELFGLIDSAGEIEPPPPSLLEKRNGFDGEALFHRAREDWHAVRADLAAGREPSQERLAALWVACDHWEKTVLADELPTPAAVNYVDNLRRLTAAATSPGERHEVAAYLRSGGHAFAGGSYGDLLFHVLKHRLSPRAGMPGSLAIAELTQAMVDRANVEIAELDTKLETLKRQNPAHNAVLRERMVPRYFADKSSVGVYAGLNSPAYEE